MHKIKTSVEQKNEEGIEWFGKEATEKGLTVTAEPGEIFGGTDPKLCLNLNGAVIIKTAVATRIKRFLDKYDPTKKYTEEEFKNLRQSIWRGI